MSLTPPPNDAIAELVATLDQDSAVMLVRMFLEGFEPAVRELGIGERVRCRRAAHNLKSSARIVGALDLSRQMAALEQRLAQPEGLVTPDDLAAAATEFGKVAGPLRAYLDGQK